MYFLDCMQHDTNILENYNTKQEVWLQGLHDHFPGKTYIRMRVGFHFPKGVSNKKLIFMYKSINSLMPIYIAELIPPLTGNVSNYDLRNNITIPFTRTEISHRSCIPSSIAL